MSKDPKQHVQILYNKALKEKARALRNSPTPAEKHFWNTLKKMPFYKEATFNRQKSLGPYIVDFYCYQFQMVIEIDGDTHGGQVAEENDRDRTAYLKSQGLKVVRFTNHEVLGNIDGVMEALEKLIKRNKE